MVKRDDRPQRPFGSGNVSDDTFERWFKILVIAALVFGAAVVITICWILVRVTLHFT